MIRSLLTAGMRRTGLALYVQLVRTWPTFQYTSVNSTEKERGCGWPIGSQDSLPCADLNGRTR